MREDIVINFYRVSKKFQKGKKLLLKQALLDFLKPSQLENFWAVRNINFKISKGESVGIVGANGSGKSTILKLIAGVLNPTIGKVEVKGRIGPLIELGAGFHPELTGRDNIYLNGTILGLSKKEIDKRFNDIVSFAQLEDFIDTPVKHYSSGMYMRLGFAIAINVNPEILLVDEILAVGDMAYQRKCLDQIEEFKKRGVTIVFISHNIDLVKQLCQKIILLDKGKIIKYGDSSKVALQYLSSIVYVDHDKKIDSKRWGDGKGQITNLKVKVDKNIRVSFDFRFNDKQQDPIFGITIKDLNDQPIFVTNTSWQDMKTGTFDNEEQTINFEFLNCLEEGKYSVSPAIAYTDGVRFYDWRENFSYFDIKKNRPTNGVININHKIYFNDAK